MSRLRAGVIGCGNLGARHAESYAELPEVELAAVCDIVREKADELAGRLKARAYCDAAEMLRTEELDCVSVCTRDDQHYEPVMAALDAGVHVFCEKPLSLVTAEAEQMVRKAEQSGVFLGVDYNRRFSMCYLRAKEAVASGRLGDISYVLMKLSQGGPRQTEKGKYYLMYELQVHSIDMLRHMAGEVTSVSAHFCDTRGLGFYTAGALSFSFEGGGVGTLIAGWDASFTQPIEWFEVGGTRGFLQVDNVVHELRMYLHDEPEARFWRPNILRDDPRFYGTVPAHVRAFCESIAAGKQPPVTGLDGLRSLQIIEAAIESFETSRTITPGTAARL
jgi:predicted dehydrogenase